MDSIRTISCKLRASDDQATQIEDTMQAFADACNFVADYGRTHRISRKYALQKACYTEVRSRFGLSANLAVRAIARAASCLRHAKTRNARFTPTSIDYDARIFRFIEKDWSASLTLLDGREKLSLKVGEFQRDALSGHDPASAVLVKKRKGYYLNIQIKEPLPEADEPTGILGIDLSSCRSKWCVEYCRRWGHRNQARILAAQLPAASVGG